MKQVANWALYLGLILGCAASGEPQYSAILCAATLLSFTVWLFGQFSSKFYLSELLIVVLSFGVEMTMIANAARNPAESRTVSLIWGQVIPLTLPFVVFFAINARRKPDERVLPEVTGFRCVESVSSSIKEE